MKMLPIEIQGYIDLVRSGALEVCEEQKQLVDLVEDTFAKENIHVDEAQLREYMGLQKYFPYQLLPWEKFVFTLHNCTYKADGNPRWPILFVMVGRGAGKNGYLAFEDFALITPVNGIKHYHVDMFATSENQAKATFNDIHEILDGNEAYFSKYFEWTQETITNKRTRSQIKYHTKAPRTKDGGRPGKVDFDEVHEYENTALEDVAVTGLGKVAHPRRTYITTDGNVRDGSLDKKKERAKKVLERQQPDGGWLYFICRLDSDAEVLDPKKWIKANPSLADPARKALLDEILLEFEEYKEDPAGHIAFPTKRMNRPVGNTEVQVTAWENIVAASRPFPEGLSLEGRAATWAVDYASTQDFVAAGVLFQAEETWYWITHTWVCRQSKTLPRIQFPLAEAEQRGELSFVDGPEIPPETPVEWVEEQREKYNLILGAIDHYRYTLLAKAFAARGYDTDRKTGNLHLTYTPEVSQVAPIITSAFLNHRIVWGDSMIMRWYTNNACRVIDKKGNITFEKIEPKSRKTDGFMALVGAFIAAMLKADELEAENNAGGSLPDVWTY